MKGFGSGRVALWVLGDFFLASLLASVLALGDVKDAAVSSQLHGQGIRVGALVGALSALDWTCLVWVAAAAVAVLWVEWRGRAVTRLLHEMGAREGFWLATMLLAWTGQGYLFPGLQLGGDVASHIVRFNEVASGLRSGALPDWTNYGYMGEPLLWFTGPLTYVVGGVLTVVVGDANLALKLLMFVTHVAAGWAFWALLRRWGVGALAAALGAAMFGGAFANLHLFLYRGETPQTVTILLLPVLFWAADGLMRGVGRRGTNALWFGLATAGLIVNHQPHALFAGLYLAVFGAGAVALGFWRRRGLPTVALAGALGVVASAVAVVPVVFEASWVMIEPESGLVRARVPSVSRLLDLVVWHDTLTTRGINYWAYLGLGLILLGLAGVVGLLRGRLRAPGRGVAGPALLCFGLALFLYNPVVRDVMFLLFFGAMLAAFGLDWLGLAGRWRLLVVGLVVLDLMSTAVQPVARTDKGFLLAAGRRLEGAGPRVVQIGIDAQGRLEPDMGPDGSVLSYGALVPRLAGNHNMAATPVHNYLAVTIERAAAELGADGRLSAATRVALGLFDVGRIVCNTSIAMGCPEGWAETETDPVLGRFVPIQAAPALFSPALATVSKAAGLDRPMLWPGDFDEPEPRVGAIWDEVTRVVAAEAPEFGRASAAAIAVPGAAAGAPGPGGMAIREYRVGLQDVRLVVEAPGAGWVQLSHPFIPSTVVERNGSRVAATAGTLGFAVVAVSAGENVITLHAGGTAVRRVSMVVSGVGVLGILGLVLWPPSPRPSPGGRGRRTGD